MTTTTATRPMTTGRAIWMAIPGPVRRALRARVPLDCEEHGTGNESMVVAVGSGAPLRWLQVGADAAGALHLRLWEVRRTNKQVAAETTTADGLTVVLQKWAATYGLTA